MNRLHGLDFLRGWAAVLVVISHYCGAFWTAGEFAGYKVSLMPHSFISQYDFFIGQLGVGIFFILSGFVITMSLTRYSGIGFLVNRMLRIYPVYIVALSLTLISMCYIYDHIPYTDSNIISQYFIVVSAYMGNGHIDGVSWTLEIELYFYIFMFLIFKLKKLDKKITLLILYIVSPLVGTYIIKYGLPTVLIYQIRLMLVGYFLYLYVNKQASLKLLLFITIFEIGCLYVIFVHFNDLPQHFMAYVCSMLIFYIVFFYKKKIGFISKFFADISFPLYAAHPFVGYAVILFFYQNGYNGWLCIIIASIVSVCLAYLVHKYIEKPSVRLSRVFNH